MAYTWLQPSQWVNGVTDPGTNGVVVGGSRYYVENALQPYSFSAPSSNTLRFEVKPGDHWPPDTAAGSAAERSEIDGVTKFAQGTTLHVAYDFTAEPGAATDSTWTIFSQWHQTVTTGGIGSPPMALKLIGDKMMVNIDEAGNAANSWSAYHDISLDQTPIVRGQAYHMDITADFDPVNGFLHIVRDGAVLLDYHGALGWSTMGSLYWKEGIYRSPGQTDQAFDFANTTVSVVASQPVDTTPPTLTASETIAGWTSSTSETISVSAADASGVKSVAVYDNGAVIGQATLGSDGAWSYTATGLAAGSHAFTATATDNAGNVSAQVSAGAAELIDLTAPTVTASETTAGVTSSTSETIHVNASDGASGVKSVAVYDNGAALGQATLGSDGVWSYTATGLAAGSHAFTATATDNAGNVSAQVSAGAAELIDLGPPTLTANETTAGWTSSTSETIRVNASDDASGVKSVAIYDNGAVIGQATLGSDGVWSYTATGLAAGSHAFTATATDNAGNVSAQVSAGAAELIDLGTPTMAITSETITGRRTRQAVFTFSGKDEAGGSGINHFAYWLDHNASDPSVPAKASTLSAGSTSLSLPYSQWHGYTLHMAAIDNVGHVSAISNWLV
jgi:hypothetical protein